MAIQRAVVSGSLLNLVSTRNMFTAEVTPVGGDTSEILWAAYLASVFDPLRGLWANTVHTDSYVIQDWQPPDWITTYETTFSKVGSVSSDALPNAVALVILGKALGKRVFGKKFFSGINEGAVASNTLIAEAVTIAVQVLAAYITPFTGIGGGTLTPGILTKTGVFKPFVGGILSAFVGSQRRRKPGVGI